MKLQFKHQQFQADAAKAVCDIFAGQPYFTPTYRIDSGVSGDRFLRLDEESRFTGWNNHPIVPSLTDAAVLENIHAVQRCNGLPMSEKLEGRYNLTIEMETGTGKTYTYIKTMYELNKAYGWSKFIIVVPSVAIREGVYKSFQVTEDHFAQEYGTKIRYFIYNSANLNQIDHFASDPNINVMIINAQAFNARSKNARRIYMELDDFRSRRPIDILARTNPVLIIDEPQSVEGAATKERLKEFHPLLTLRYSATHKDDSKYNMVYRLDAMDAYNKKLVKKIKVKGISASGTTATEGFVYLISVNTFENKNPTATIEYEVKRKTGVKRIRSNVSEGFDLYENSGKLDEYKDRFTISRIDGRDCSIEFVNGVRLTAGSVRGACNEDQLRRIQIRETILSHIEQERMLRRKGIKVLSLFFIDEVAKYRRYEDGQPVNGIYADMFEEEYDSILEEMGQNLIYQQGGDAEYLKELLKQDTHSIHAGYFSIDKNKHFIDGKIDRKEKTSDDVDAYDLIMRNKERLLDKREPVRFIFSHSALREGWDNPNVFQICTLKQSGSEVRKRQEVGRGLRLCVNQAGQRMDASEMDEDVHTVNVLTVVASESYEAFSRALQSELAEVITDRPKRVTQALFEGMTVKDAGGNKHTLTPTLAQTIYNTMVRRNYVDDEGRLTDTWYDAKKSNRITLPDAVAAYADDIINIVNSVFDPSIMLENANVSSVEVQLDQKKLDSVPFKELWKRINAKSAYVVDFEPKELIEKSIHSLNQHLTVEKIHFTVTTGVMDTIESKESLQSGKAFQEQSSATKRIDTLVTSGTRYDLLGKIVDETGLTRKDVAEILQGINPSVFEQFQQNPEDFILKASKLINEEKATIIVEHITYNKIHEAYDTDIFTEPTLLRRVSSKNALAVNKNLYNYLIYDSDNEKNFANDLETHKDVVIYVKLPKGFYISTPVGHYNPDWAITFDKNNVKHIYFVAETKGTLETLQLRAIEDAKISCARKHFQAISSDEVVYDVVNSYSSLMDKVMK
jgi:type III restriction enzyme